MELCCVSIEVDFCFRLQQERLCKTDLSGLKLSVRNLWEGNVFSHVYLSVHMGVPMSGPVKGNFR